MKSIAIRRHHRKRLWDKRKKYFTCPNGNDKRILKTPKPCSCYMCGNARKYFNEITEQEQKHNQSTKDQLNEI